MFGYRMKGSLNGHSANGQVQHDQPVERILR